MKQDKSNEAEYLKLFGRVLIERRSPFGNMIRIYEKGFISVDGLFGTIPRPEKLLSINFIDQPQLMSGSRRPLISGAVRDSHLVLVTSERSETINFRDASNNTVSDILELVAVAQTTLGDGRASTRESSPNSEIDENPFAKKNGRKNRSSKSKSLPRDEGLPGELERLTELHKSGSLTAEEFSKAKAKLLE
jgi:hypothetical protein